MGGANRKPAVVSDTKICYNCTAVECRCENGDMIPQFISTSLQSWLAGARIQSTAHWP